MVESKLDPLSPRTSATVRSSASVERERSLVRTLSVSGSGLRMSKLSRADPAREDRF
jgi:hypothetical protein